MPSVDTQRSTVVLHAFGEQNHETKHITYIQALYYCLYLENIALNKPEMGLKR